METDTVAEWAAAPWWLDAVAEGDVVEVAERWAVGNSAVRGSAAGDLADGDSAGFGPGGVGPGGVDPGGVDFSPLSVTETLLAVAAVGPGPEAARLLVSLRGRELTADQRLSVVQLWQPLLGWVAGAEQTAILDLVGPAPTGATDPQRVLEDGFWPAELGPALHASSAHARDRIDQARLMAGAFKPVGDQLKAGRLDPYRVWLITKTLLTLPPQAAEAVQAQVLPGAAGLTGGQLGKALRKAARAADPDWGVRMFAKSQKTRRVGFDSRGQDGLVLLFAHLPPVEALAVQRHLEAAAQAPCPVPGGDRCHDERMADALVAAVIGAKAADPTTPQPPVVQLRVTVDLPTLLGLRHNTAQLVGYGEIPAGLARDLAGDAEWLRWVHDPVTGMLLDRAERGYRPSQRLERHVRAVDAHCRYPGCERDAERCDLDHVCPHGRGGATSSLNLGALCRFHHRCKTHGGYHLTRDPDGICTWVTPLGRAYQTAPHDYRPGTDRGP